MRQRSISTQRLLRILDRVEIVLQRRHRDRHELYGSVTVLPDNRYRVILAVEACLRDGGLPVLLKTLVHELVHIDDWECGEAEVERRTEELWRGGRKYKLRSRLAEAALGAALKRLFR